MSEVKYEVTEDLIVGASVTALRYEARLSQADLAAGLEMSCSGFSPYEHGRVPFAVNFLRKCLEEINSSYRAKQKYTMVDFYAGVEELRAFLIEKGIRLVSKPSPDPYVNKLNQEQLFLLMKVNRKGPGNASLV